MPANDVPAVARALRLLETLAAAPHGLAAGSLEQIDNGSRSGMYALLSTLRSREWLVQDDQGHYLIGPAIRRLVPDAGDDEAMAVEAFTAALDTVATDETVLLAVPGADGPRVLARGLSERIVHASFRVGDIRSTTSAPAQVLRADVDPTAGDLRATGVAEVADDDVVEVAAPVCRDGRRPDAVASIVIPRQRATPAVVREQRDRVRTVAAEVSRRLGATAWLPWETGTTTIGAARTLDDAEVNALLTGRLGAQLACLTDTGTPHVVPLWFEYADDHVWLAASPGSSWARYVAAGAAVSLTVEEPWPNLRRVFIQGHARPVDVDDPTDGIDGGVLALRSRLARRYLGSGAALDTMESSNGWSVVKVTPERIIGRAGLQAVAS